MVKLQMKTIIIFKKGPCKHFESSFQALLSGGNHFTTHGMNKRRLLIEVYKCINKDIPPFSI